MKRLTTIVSMILLLVGLCATTLHAGTPNYDNEASENDENQEWIEVNLEVPGSLGVQILYKVDLLTDVTRLRVSGSINETDWSTIKSCSNLVDLDLGNASSIEVPQSQFENNKTIKSVTLPSDLGYIWYRAFYNSGIEAITIPASVWQFVGESCFQGSAIKTVIFEEGCLISEIPDRTFASCSNLQEVVFSDNIKKLGTYAFSNCNNLSSIILPKNLEVINDYCFYYAGKLQDVLFPECLKSIGDRAFYYADLTAINLPSHVTSIGSEAFSYCRNATEIVLPTSICEYQQSVFSGVNSLSKIRSYCAVPPTFKGKFSLANAEVEVPDFAIANYKLDSFWSQAKSIRGGVDADHWVIDTNRTLSLTDNLRFNGKPSLVMSEGSNLIIGGMAALPLSEFTLFNDFYKDQYAQVLNSCPAVSADMVNLDNYMYSNTWYFFTVPFEVKVSDITASGHNGVFAIRYYDGSARAANGVGGSWKDMGEDEILTPGTGYIMQTNANGYYRFVANGDNGVFFNPNARMIALESNASENASDSGWNLVGNPYSSYYDLYHSMLTSPVTVWDRSQRTYRAYSMIDDNLVLKPYQAFFIQASDELSEIAFSTAGRQLSATSSRTLARHANYIGESRNVFNIMLSNGEKYDQTRVVINEYASTEYEMSRDASKFSSLDNTIPQVFTVDENGTALAINERPGEDGNVILGYYAPETGMYSISCDRADGDISLEDKLLGKVITLKEGEKYEFEVKEEGSNSERFCLKFTPSVPTSVNNIKDGIDANVTINGNEVTISNAYTGAKVYSLDGKLLENISGNSDITFSLLKGVYVIRMGSVSRKLIIK